MKTAVAVVVKDVVLVGGVIDTLVGALVSDVLINVAKTVSITLEFVVV